jgi:hypothetical protein
LKIMQCCRQLASEQAVEVAARDRCGVLGALAADCGR